MPRGSGKHGGARPVRSPADKRIDNPGRPPSKGTTRLQRLLMERHGYSPEEAVAGILSGELATVLIPDEHRWALARWLAAGLPAEGLEEVREALEDVIRQLTRA
jgi:hypothetical protein